MVYGSFHNQGLGAKGQWNNQPFNRNYIVEKKITALCFLLIKYCKGCVDFMGMG